MATETKPNTKPLLELTEAAIRHVKSLLERQGTPDHCLRVGVTGGGCSGLSYKMSTEEAPRPGDKLMEMDGLKVIVDMKSALYLAGLEIDYCDDLMNAGFQYRNPNAKQSCGCGTSFSM